MPTLMQNKEFVNYIVDLMQCIGPVYAKAMFGGHGIYLDGLMFALIEDDTLYLKVDADTKHLFIKLGLPAFSYMRSGKKLNLAYFQAPEETLEDSEAMNHWANKAYSAALRANATKRRLNVQPESRV